MKAKMNEEGGTPKKAKRGGRRGLLVGITGSIGAGKSAVAQIYREAGFPVFSADEIAREIVMPNSPALKEIRLLFGPKSIKLDGNLDRALVRAKITENPELRLKLEGITHPRIQKRSFELAEAEFKRGAKIVFYEAPLLFEAKSHTAMDKVICVHAPEALLVERAMKRDGSSRQSAEGLLAAQLPQSEKMKRADYLVRNEGDLSELRANALEVLEQIKAEASPGAS